MRLYSEEWAGRIFIFKSIFFLVICEFLLGYFVNTWLESFFEEESNVGGDLL